MSAKTFLGKIVLSVSLSSFEKDSLDVFEPTIYLKNGDNLNEYVLSNVIYALCNRIYDSIPVMFVSGVLRIVGGFIWLVGLVGLGAGIYSLIIRKVINEFFVTGSISFAMLLLGSVFILAGGAFEKETDSNKIYAYSASILALVSCIVSIIALLGM